MDARCRGAGVKQASIYAPLGKSGSTPGRNGGRRANRMHCRWYASLLDRQEYLQGWIGHGLVVRDDAARKVKTTFRCLEEESRATSGASASIQRRLLQVLLLQAFQAEARRLGNDMQAQGSAAKGVFTALRAMQAQPEVEWTVATLAAVAFMSRSVFASRFEQMLGLSSERVAGKTCGSTSGLPLG